ncbi:AAA family ATPase [Chitinophaga cymbidii]|nr:AAA family ATPase [Chitinophaga cymbidii]
MVHHNFYVITGGPGVGKTTLLHELEKRNYRCMPEAARRIIQEQMAQNGDALPWENKARYAELMLEGSVNLYKQADQGTVTFFDRGIPDVLAYVRLTGLPLTETLTDALTSFRYHPLVFILPPWKEIYATDSERKQTWEEAVATFEVMKEAYTGYGYTIVEVPPMEVGGRADFVLQTAGLR